MVFFSFLLLFLFFANINNIIHIFLVYFRGIHSAVWCGFSPFLSPHCMVRFGQDHHRITLQFSDHMLSAMQFDMYIMVCFVGFGLENFSKFWARLAQPKDCFSFDLGNFKNVGLIFLYFGLIKSSLISFYTWNDSSFIIIVFHIILIYL